MQLRTPSPENSTSTQAATPPPPPAIARGPLPGLDQALEQQALKRHCLKHRAQSMGALNLDESRGTELAEIQAHLKQDTNAAVQAILDKGTAEITRIWEDMLAQATATVDSENARLEQFDSDLQRLGSVVEEQVAEKRKEAEEESVLNRRELPRVPLAAQVGFQSETNFFQGFSIDISEGGCFVATVEQLPRGRRVDLELSLPDNTVVKAVAEVRWVRDFNDMAPELHPGMGLQFVEVDSEARQAIEQFVQAREPLFYVD